MTIPDATPLPASELAEVILRTSRRLRRATATHLEPLPVNPHQARALRTIVRAEPVRMAALAELLHVAPRSATEVTDALVAGGWVTRAADPADRRTRVLRPTASGRALAADVDAARAAAAEEVLGDLSPAARTAIVEALGDVPAGRRGDRTAT
ncbi:MAG: MarR family transcriptional regulator [Propionibacteriaceae bacterium]|nr:MarR family transcriptional regulator [Propionibacteriaceae bacterium]